jgi:hypothetical protein
MRPIPCAGTPSTRREPRPAPGLEHDGLRAEQQQPADSPCGNHGATTPIGLGVPEHSHHLFILRSFLSHAEPVCASVCAEGCWFAMCGLRCVKGNLCARSFMRGKGLRGRESLLQAFDGRAHTRIYGMI